MNRLFKGILISLVVCGLCFGLSFVSLSQVVAAASRRLIGVEDLANWAGGTRTFDSVTADGQILTLHKTGNEVDVCAAFGRGSDTTQAVLQTAITAVGTSNKRTFVLTPGTWPITGDLTIPANISLKVPSGTLLTVATTKTLTINSPLEAGLYPIFSCTGTGKVVFGAGAIKEVYPEWWGFLSSASASVNGAAVQAAFNSILYTNVTYSGCIRFSQGGNIQGPINVMSGVQITGLSLGYPKLTNTAVDGSSLFYFKNTRDVNPTPFWVTIKDLRIYGNSSSGDGVYCSAPYMLLIDRCVITDNGGRGINCELGASPYAWGQNISITNSVIQSNALGGIRLYGNIVLGEISKNQINQNKKYGIYATGFASLKINSNEFAAYHWTTGATKNYPICLSGGNNIKMSNNHFENIGGEANDGTTLAKFGGAIRIGFDGDTQAYNGGIPTFGVTINDNDFTAASGLEGDTNYIWIDCAKNLHVGPNNFFEKVPAYTGVVNAVYFGANVSPVGADGYVFRDNQYMQYLDAKITAYTMAAYHSPLDLKIMWEEDIYSNKSLSSAAGVLTIPNTHNDFYITLTEDITSVLFPSPVLADKITLRFQQSAAGNNTVAGWQTFVHLPAFTMTATADKYDVLTFAFDYWSQTWWCTGVIQDQ